MTPTLFFVMLAMALLLTVCLSGLTLAGKGKGYLHGLLLVLFMFFAGLLSAQSSLMAVSTDWPSEEHVYEGVLVEYPCKKEKSVLLEMQCGSRKVFLYVPPDSMRLSELSPGNTVSFNGIVKAPDAYYRRRSGVSGILWVNSSMWKRLDSPARKNLSVRRSLLHHRALSLYDSCGFSDKAYGLVAAITLGSREFIDEDMRNDFSDAGVSHVLAVSGLHVGIMYAFLSILFPPVFNLLRFRKIKDGMILGLLWGYALLIGMPVSITRALIMFSFLALCRMCGRDSAPVNSLSSAALVILIISPLNLFTIGFQLSFSAVLSILLFHPFFSDLLKSRFSAVQYLLDLVCVSVSAQLGVAPLACLHFGTFPTYFLLMNIVVMPLMFVFVCCSVMLWIFMLFIPLRDLLVILINNLTCFMESAVALLLRLPDSTLQVDCTGQWPVVRFYVAVFCFYLSLNRKSVRFMLPVLGLFAVEGIMHILSVGF